MRSHPRYRHVALMSALAGGAVIGVILARHVAAQPDDTEAQHAPLQTSSQP